MVEKIHETETGSLKRSTKSTNFSYSAQDKKKIQITFPLSNHTEHLAVTKHLHFQACAAVHATDSMKERINN